MSDPVSSTPFRPNILGNVFESRGKLYSRTPIGKGDRHCVALPNMTREEADARASVLAGIARDLRATKDESVTGLLPQLLDRAAAADEKALATLLETVERLASGKAKVKPKTPVTKAALSTFGDVATAWTSGELARLHPDHVGTKRKRSADGDRLLLDRYAMSIWDVPIARFTIEHAEKVMAALPTHLSPMSRRHVAQAMHRVLALSVFPLRLTAASPLPRGWLPKIGKQPPQAMPFSDESDRFVAFDGEGAAPVVLRLLAGFIAREGMRHEEAEVLTWADIDREHGLVKLDENKTDDPRVWALRPGTARALRTWFTMSGKPDNDALVFTTSGTKLGVRAHEYRAFLLAAGVDRDELHHGSKVTTPTGFHGLRGLFVSEALARGESERWAMDRTGHTTSLMISRYQQRARMFAEARMPNLGDLDVVLGWATRNADAPDTGSNGGTPKRDPGIKNRDPRSKKKRIGRRKSLQSKALRTIARNKVDLKSVVRKDVSVRIRPGLPTL